MRKMKELLRRHRPFAILMGIVLVLTAIPVADAFLAIGSSWAGIPPAFTDESLYLARTQAIVKGHPADGNPYFFEHRNDPPLVVFGGAWINALPFLSGMPFDAALLLNFILWSLLFAAALYWLFREIGVSSWFSVLGTVFTYIESYAHVWRPVNLQPVYPLYFLFYIALARLIREQSRKNVVLLALTVGATFYLFAFLWQIALITLGVLFLYALARRNRMLAKAAFQSAALGVLIGLPVPLYMLWLSLSSPYYWESMARLGLVDTHIPMAETIYSGGWIGVVGVLLAVLLWRVRSLREDADFKRLCLFVGISGLGLWVMQGSNLFTGKLLETGEHVRILILPWLVFSTVSAGVFAWRRRALMTTGVRAFAIAMFAILCGANLYFTDQYFSPFLPSDAHSAAWHTQELYAKPFAWLNQNEKEPVVVWSDPHDDLATYLPIYTKHFSLYAYWGMLDLVPEGEIRERYLVSQYFNDPSVASLESGAEMGLYLGRRDQFHAAKTIEREVKVCRALFFWDTHKDCGTVPTPQSLLGDKFFVNIENRFRTDIKPNIKAYLAKYHVAYILKDKVLDPTYHPEMLGAKLVYADDRFEIYHL